MQTIALDRLH